MVLMMQPSGIYYSQSSIDSRFQNKRNIGLVLDDICEGRLFAYNFPRIRVTKQDGKWVTSDNRRLWLFRQLERLGKCDRIPVKEIDSILDGRLTTTNGGESVVVRGDILGEWASKPDKPKSERSMRDYVQFEHPNVRNQRYRNRRFHPYRR